MDDGIFAEVFLEPASSAYFFGHSALVRPLKNFKKWPRLYNKDKRTDKIVTNILPHT